MPIYMKIDGIKGNVTAHNGGAWKTTNFQTRDASANGAVGRTPIKVYICPGDPGVVPISRISLTPGSGGVEGRDPAAGMKVANLLNMARSQGPTGKLYVATDAGVYQNANTRNFDGQGRLLVGTDQGVWSGRTNNMGKLVVGTDDVVLSKSASKFNGQHNLHQLGLAALSGETVEIIVTDAQGAVLSAHRLRNATMSPVPQSTYGRGVFALRVS